MKRFHRLPWLAALLAAAFVVSFAGTVRAQDADAPKPTQFWIKKVEKLAKGNPLLKTQQIYLPDTEEWKLDVEQLQITLSALSKIPSAGSYVKVYFYDGDKALVSKAEEPNNYRAGNETSRKPPEAFQPSGLSMAQFAVPDKPWAVAVVVFGNADSATAKVFPGGSLADYDFPEAKLLAAP